jgi:hypothetical protein
VGNDLDVGLVPPLKVPPVAGALVQASITNLPDVSDPEETKLNFLTHFIHFYEPVTFLPPAPNLRLPHPHIGTITSGTSFCPPVTHTSGE